MNITKFQIGKLGITPGTIDSLLLAFKNHKQVRVSVLKSSGRDRNSMADLASELSNKLNEKSGNKYSPKIIGFTIILIKSGNKQNK